MTAQIQWKCVQSPKTVKHTKKAVTRKLYIYSDLQ